MLVINRKPGEEIVLFTPDGKELGRVQYCKKDPRSLRASIAIQLPKDYLVMRAELLEQKGGRR